MKPTSSAATTFAANRQTLLFSATFSDEVRAVADRTLRRGFVVVNTVREEEEQTHTHVEQTIVTVPLGTVDGHVTCHNIIVQCSAV